MIFVSLFLLIIITILFIKVFIKLTTGICRCSKHLVGKVVIITGGNTGIGFETAKDLAERGARVIIACRNQNKGIAARDQIIALTGNSDVHYQELNLASLTSVRNFARSVNNTEKRIDILINNAGVCEVENVRTEDGLLLAMQTNHFGPFLLTTLLLPLLKSSAPSRVINVSSAAYLRGKIDFDNLNNEKGDESFFQVYRNTKMCNVLMTLELARMLEGTGVSSNSLHPGVVATDILLNLRKSWFRYMMPFLKLFFKTPWEGAQTSIFLAVAPTAQAVSGKYFVDCKEANLSNLAQDEAVARKLWEVSEKLVALKE